MFVSNFLVNSRRSAKISWIGTPPFLARFARQGRRRRRRLGGPVPIGVNDLMVQCDVGCCCLPPAQLQTTQQAYRGFRNLHGGCPFLQTVHAGSPPRQPPSEITKSRVALISGSISSGCSKLHPEDGKPLRTHESVRNSQGSKSEMSAVFPERCPIKSVCYAALSSSAVCLLAAESEVERAEQLRSSGVLRGLADTLGLLAVRVFEVPLRCLAISVEPASPGADDCGHLGAEGPLLFSWRLFEQVQDPGFWFGEFCHALAHKAVGAGHLGSSHTMAMQALYAWHFPRAGRVLEGAAGQAGRA
ncbi:unnamed protein product [Prorocentrum cordatum]|uniref:Uncharacterized protein n=1 Tax=Prorocentrum cordatum TaxID=2364126 RepID=A0ABN9U2P9_9DINO|nr:unnamed protein product [Polarella glacialis]